MLYIAIVLGFAVGAAIAWFAARNHGSALQARLAAVKQQFETIQIELGNVKQQLADRSLELAQSREGMAAAAAKLQAAGEQIGEKDKLLSIHAEALAETREEVLRLTAHTSRLSTEVDEQKKSNENQLKLWSASEQHFKDTFDAIASRALQGNNQQFLELAKQELERQQKTSSDDLAHKKDTIAGMLNDTKERLGEIDKQVRLMDGERKEAFGDISQQITGLVNLQHELSHETRRLSQALEKPTVRGSWGEMQLRRVVELAGMEHHCDFSIQVNVRDDDDNLLRPDMTVNLPSGRTIVIDSKVSLKAYLAAADCDEDAQREKELKKHAEQVKKHLTKLSAKNYWDQFDNTPDFVVAFFPGEVFLSAALQQDPTLIEFGVEQKVILATPTTLIALLKSVSYGWRQEDIAKNAQQISELGKQLYGRLSTMYEYVGDLRSNLDSSVKNFNKMVGAMESRVMVSARRFRELGATVADELIEVEQIESFPRELEGPPVRLRALAAAADDASDFTD